MPPHPSTAPLIAQELQRLAEPILGEVAQLLADLPDEQLFGDTEFAVRDRILRLVAAAYAARLAGKKTRPANLTGEGTL